MRAANPSDDGTGIGRHAALVGVFAAIVLLAVTDIATDLGEGTSLGHVVLEGLVVVAGLVGVGLGLRRITVLRRDAVALRGEAERLGARLAASHREAERWRNESRELLDGLGAAIDRQFVAWSLSPAEREIASLLLKGLSHKEIATLRRVSEATVRQQSRGVYRKAGVDGRHELAAFFLEGLLPGG